MDIIRLVNLKKKFDDTWVTKGVNLSIPQGKMTVIIGKSGEGKSVLLKQVIGLISPTSGEVFVNNKNTTTLSFTQRQELFTLFGYVFQFAALLDSLNIFENIGIKLLEEGVPPDEVLAQVKEKLALVNLSEEVLYQYPAELSGGMRKRVGLARTLMSNPHILLYDEPTTGLDPITARIILELMYDMQRKFNITSVVISHDLEIFQYADKVALLYDGAIQWFGDAATIWESDNPYIYQFIRGLPEGPIKTDYIKNKKLERS